MTAEHRGNAPEDVGRAERLSVFMLVFWENGARSGVGKAFLYGADERLVAWERT